MRNAQADRQREQQPLQLLAFVALRSPEVIPIDASAARRPTAKTSITTSPTVLIHVAPSIPKGLAAPGALHRAGYQREAHGAERRSCEAGHEGPVATGGTESTRRIDQRDHECNRRHAGIQIHSTIQAAMSGRGAAPGESYIP